jgi:hypothetical protein
MQVQADMALGWEPEAGPVPLVTVNTYEVPAGDQGDNAGLPADRIPAYGTNVGDPQGFFAAYVQQAVGAVFSRGERWREIVQDRLLIDPAQTLRDLPRDEVFTRRVRIRANPSHPYPILGNLASFIGQVNQRTPIGRFRIYIYSVWQQDLIVGEVISPELPAVFGANGERLVAILRDMAADYLALVAGDRPGSDPTELPDDVGIQGPPLDYDNIFQNCGVQFIPASLYQYNGDPIDLPNVMTIQMDGVPLNLIPDPLPPNPDGLNCAIQAVCRALSLTYSARLFKSLKGPHNDKTSRKIPEVIAALPPALREDVNYVNLSVDFTVLNYRHSPSALRPDTVWLVGYENHAYTARVAPRPPPDASLIADFEANRTAQHEPLLVFFDLETRGLVYDRLDPKQGTQIVPACACFAWIDLGTGEEGDFKAVLDPDAFEADLIDEQLVLQDHMDMDPSFKRVRITPEVKRTIYKAHLLTKGVTPQSRRKMTPHEIVEMNREFVAELSNHCKTEFQAKHSRNRMLESLTTLQRVLWRRTYSTSRVLPHYQMLFALRDLPPALTNKRPYVNLYAHNAQRFDSYFVLEALIQLLRDKVVESIDSIIMKPGAIMNVKWTFNNGVRYDLQCTYAHLPGSLASLCKAFSLPEEFSKLDKVTLPDGTEIGTMELCLQKPELDPCDYIRDLKRIGALDSYEEYCLKDCQALRAIGVKAADQYGRIFGHVPGTDEYYELRELFLKALSASSMSMKLFDWYMDRNDPELMEKYNALRACSIEEWDFEKSAIVGGASISNQRGTHFQSLCCVDVCGQYPHALSTGAFTLGETAPMRPGRPTQIATYRRRCAGIYYDESNDEVLHPITPYYLVEGGDYMGPGTYVVTGRFHREGKTRYWFNSLPIRQTGKNLDWRAESFDEPARIGWIDLNRLIRLGELSSFTIWSDSRVPVDEVPDMVSGDVLYAPYLSHLIRGKDQAQAEGNTGKRTLYKLLANGFSGKLQMNAHQKQLTVDPNPKAAKYYTTTPSVTYRKSPCRHAVEFLGHVRNMLFEAIDALGRENVVLTETDSIVFASALLYRLNPWLGTTLGKLVPELDSTTIAYVLEPKTYYMEGMFEGKKIIKMAAKGLPRRNVTAQFYARRVLGEDVIVPTPMLKRVPNALAILDAGQMVRNTRARKFVDAPDDKEFWPVFNHWTDVTMAYLPDAPY